MNNVSYMVQAIDQAGDMIAMYDSVALPTLRYSRVLNGVGTLQFTACAITCPNIAEVAQKDVLLRVWRYVDDAEGTDEGVYCVRMVEHYVDSAGEYWIVGALSLEFLLGQRIIDPRNDALAANWWSTKDGAADTVMCDLVTEQAGASAGADQQVIGLSVTTAAGTGENVRGRWQWTSLLEALQALTVKGQMDFMIEHVSGITISFEASVMGSDKTRTANYPSSAFVLFSPDFGTMQNPRHTQDWRTERTVAYLLGQGPGDSRNLHSQAATGSGDTNYSYAASVADARQVEPGASILDEYQTQAEQILAQNVAKDTFTGQVTRASEHYRELWDLGDRVTMLWGDAMRDLRITTIEVNVAAEGETITPTLEPKLW